MGVVKGDTRSFDNSSYVGICMYTPILYRYVSVCAYVYGIHTFPQAEGDRL